MLASYAAALLFRLNDDKPQDYKRRLPPELAGNAFRCDPLSWNEVCSTELKKHYCILLVICSYVFSVKQ